MIDKDEAERLFDAKTIGKKDFAKSYSFLSKKEIDEIYLRAKKISMKEIRKLLPAE